jgi:choline-glycine betaine transporter
VTSLSTVTLTVREILAFTPAESPAFATRVSRTFETTKANLTATAQAIVMFLIGFGPWIIILVVPLTIAFYMGRRLLRGTVASISNP